VLGWYVQPTSKDGIASPKQSGALPSYVRSVKMSTSPATRTAIVYKSGFDSPVGQKVVMGLTQERVLKNAFLGEDGLVDDDFLTIEIAYTPNHEEYFCDCLSCEEAQYCETFDSEFVVFVRWYSKRMLKNKTGRNHKLYRHTTLKDKAAVKFLYGVIV
jgi:hypothetical protein